MSWCRRSEDNTLRVTCEWQCHEWYNKYGCDFFQQIELLVACKTALVHIHVLAIAILTGWYIWPLARDPLLCFLRRARVAQWVRQLDYLITHTSLSPKRLGFASGFVNYKKGCTRPAAASDKVYQLLAHGRWFSPGTSASSTTKNGRHDTAEILLKVALNTISSVQFSFLRSLTPWHISKRE